MLVSLATTPASPDRLNEDFAAVSDSLAVLLDGATIPPGTTPSCQHDARWFTRELGGRIFADLSAEPNLPIADAVAHAIAATAKLHAETCELNDHTHPSATVVVLREQPSAYEFFVLGDSTIVFDTTDQQAVARTDRRLARIAAAERRHVHQTPYGSSERQSARAHLLQAERAARNSADGYWIAATNPDAASHAVEGTIGRARLRRAALLTDGAANIVDRYQLMDWSQALDIIASGGPLSLIEDVRRAEDSDPKAKRWPRSKQHDDATIVYCVPEAIGGVVG
jgi:hypothetical protein